MATTTLDGVTVATPTIEIQLDTEEVGETMRMANGSLRGDTIVLKENWTITWQRITKAERDVIRGKLKLLTSYLFSPPSETGTYTVRTQHPFTETQHKNYSGSDEAKYDITVTLLEV